MATFQKIISENSAGQVSISNRLGIGLSEAPSAPLHIENGNNGHAVIRLEDARSGDNSITAGGRIDFHSNHIQANKTLGRIIYEQEGSNHQQVRFQIKGTLAGVGDKKLVVNDDNGKWSFYNNYTEDLALVIKNQKLGIGGVTNPTEAIHVNGHILLPTHTNNVSYKLRLTGAGTSEIYRSSYDNYYTTSLTHYMVGSNGITARTSDSARQILIEHSANYKRISSNMGTFALLAGHAGALGFLTQGSTTTFSAIQSGYTDNNTSDLIFNSRSGGSNVERMRIRNDGNVGIGTSLATQRLHIKGSTNGSIKTLIENTNTGSSAYATLAFQSDENHSVHPGLFLNGSNNTNYAGANSLNMYQYGSLPLGFVTNNILRMSIAGDGKVKMGTDTTTSARGFLDVKGDGHNQGFYVNAGSVGLPTDIAHSAGAGTFDIQVRNYRLGTTSGGDISIYPKHGTNSIGIGTASYQNRIFVNGSNGNTGIATTSPTSIFHVNGILTVNAQLRSHTGNGLYLNAQGSSGGFSHRFQQAGTDRVVIADSTGYVGIGTTSPSKILHIYDGTYNLQIDGNELFHSDSNPFYIKSADSIIIQPSQSTKATFTSTGLGIGTTSPSYALHTTGDTFTSEKFLILQNKLIQSRNSAGGGNYGNSIKIKNSSTGNMEFTLEHDSYDFVFTNGKVGIGTTNPVYGLDVRSTGYFATASTVDQLRLGDTTNGTTSSIRSVNDTMSFKPDGSNTRFFIGNTGKVGIGTTSPQRSLHLQSSSANYLRLETTGDTGAGMEFMNDNGRYTIGVLADDSFGIYKYSQFSGGYALRIQAGGVIDIPSNVGIGTTSPGKPLTINHASDVWKAAIQHNGADKILLGTGTSTQTISTAVASDNLDFSLGGSTKMRLTGTDATLKLYGGSAFDTTSVATMISSSAINLVGSDDMRILFTEGTSTYRGQIGYEHAGSTYIGIWDSGSSSNPSLVSQGGKIGIGTTSPSATFEIYKNTTSGNDKLFRIYNGSALQWEIQGDGTMSAYTGNNINNILQLKGTWQTDLELAGGNAASEAAAGDIVFKTNNIEKARLTNTGKLGIGTTSPAGALSVEPDTNAITILGRAKLYSAVTDYMYLSHFDYATGYNYAVKQAPTGSTTINAPTGQSVSLGINNSSTVTVKSDGVDIRKSGSNARHADTALMITNTNASTMTAQMEIMSGNAGYSNLYLGDTNSYSQGGLSYDHTNDDFNFRASNSIKMTLNSGGLSVTPNVDTTHTFGRIRLHSVSSDYATFSHYDQDGGSEYALRQSAGGATNVNARTGQKVHLAIANSHKVTLSGDYFGIGTTSPNYKLDLVDGMRINRSSNDPYIILARDNTSVAQIRGVSGGGINITDGGSGGTNSTSRIYVDNSGNVGIGDITPSKKLDVGGSFQVQGTADFQDTVVFEGDVDLTNASIEGLPAITVSPTTIFKCATTATNINYGVSLTKGDILFGTPTTENGTYISHTNNDEKITLKRAGEYEISVTLVVTAQSASNRFTCLTYVEHYNSSNTLLDSYGLEAMYIRSNGANYNSGAMAGQIRITTGSLNTWVKVTSMVLDRESSGTVPLNTTYSKIRIDKIDYNQ